MTQVNKKELLEYLSGFMAAHMTDNDRQNKANYEALKYAKRGDMYLPGSESYRKKNLKDGLLLKYQFIGYNQASIFVQKNNPKKIKSLDSLLDENIATIIANPSSGSIGKMTKKILINYKGEEFYEDVFDAAVEVGTDSRNLNKTLIDKSTDMTINWRATAFFDENKEFVDIVDINDKFAPKKKLSINLLSFSKHKDIALDFMRYANSKDGEKIMNKYGFKK